MSATPLRSKIEQQLGWIVLALLLCGCLLVMLPFVSALLWGTVLSVSSWPLYQRLLKLLRGRQNLAAALLALAMICVILLPFVIIGSTLAEKLVPGNRPVIHKALAQQTITVAIGGTLSKPALNREAMKGQLTKIVQGAMKDAVKEAGAGVADDLIKKGLEGIFKKR